ncbi:MAG: hypothetical protein QXX08_08470 [Candidatus Bathyarchaeia archaeon]
MEQVVQTHKTNGEGNGRSKKKSQPKAVGSIQQIHHSIFDPMKYMLKLPKNKKVNLPNGQVKWEKTESDYLPVAARIMWFRREHPDWSIVTKTVQLANKGIVMKAIVKNAEGRIIATARKKETEIGFPDYIEKAETGAIGRALALCGYGTLQAPEFDEGERLADAPIEKVKGKR